MNVRTISAETKPCRLCDVQTPIDELHPVQSFKVNNKFDAISALVQGDVEPLEKKYAKITVCGDCEDLYDEAMKDLEEARSMPAKSTGFSLPLGKVQVVFVGGKNARTSLATQLVTLSRFQVDHTHTSVRNAVSSQSDRTLLAGKVCGWAGKKPATGSLTLTDLSTDKDVDDFIKQTHAHYWALAVSVEEAAAQAPPKVFIPTHI